MVVSRTSHTTVLHPSLRLVHTDALSAAVLVASPAEHERTQPSVERSAFADACQGTGRHRPTAAIRDLVTWCGHLVPAFGGSQVAHHSNTLLCVVAGRACTSSSVSTGPWHNSYVRGYVKLVPHNSDRSRRVHNAKLPVLRPFRRPAQHHRLVEPSSTGQWRGAPVGSPDVKADLSCSSRGPSRCLPNTSPETWTLRRADSDEHRRPFRSSVSRGYPPVRLDGHQPPVANGPTTQ